MFMMRWGVSLYVLVSKVCRTCSPNSIDAVLCGLCGHARVVIFMDRFTTKFMHGWNRKCTGSAPSGSRIDIAPVFCTD